MNINQLTGKSDEHIHWFSEHTGIHQQVVEPWQQLCHAAKKQGHHLTIASGFRSFDRQLSIWNRKFTGELVIKNIENNIIDIDQLTDKEIAQAILTFSALPGASRHHWGTDIDFYDKHLLVDGQSLQLEPWEYQTAGPFAALTTWLKENAQKFGFYFPYDKYRGGIAQEPWHLSYYPLAKTYQEALNREHLAQCLSIEDIEGKQTIINELEDILAQYVLNVTDVNTGEMDNG